MNNRDHRYRSEWIRRAHTEADEGVEENDLDPDEGNQTSCGVCALPIFSTPYHTCLDDDGNPSFRHKCCSQQRLPEVLTQHSLHRVGPLHLHNDPHDDIICNNCQEECNKGFFYQCPEEYCRFSVDVKCCTTVKVVHRSHRHELTFIQRRHDSLTCGACGMQNEGLFYGCLLCQFYLHKDCALLPNIILLKNHENMQHPLALVFTLPLNSIKFQRCEACSICKGKFSSVKQGGGVYVCLRCDDAVIHVECAAVSHESANFRTVSSGDIANGLPHFPMKNEHTSLLPYLLEYQSNSGSGTIEEVKKFFHDKIHDHELILYEEYWDEPSEMSRLCDVCIEPVLAPFYKCPQCIDFYLHRCCANLPLLFQHHSHYRSPWGDHCKDKPSMQLISGLSRMSNYSGRVCDGCRDYHNGFLYECQQCSLGLYVSCALLPNVITYEFHGKSHILFLSYCQGVLYSICPSCTAGIFSLFYECNSCPNFRIHVSCALQPISVSYKYDRHPLELTPLKGPTPEYDNDENYCEICETGMTINGWFYHCKECVTSFHIDCIPCVSRYICRIKTGRTIRVRCHDCQLTSIQMETNYSYTCSQCQESLKGKEKNWFGELGIAFECSKCSFWLCWRCAYIMSRKLRNNENE